MQIITDDSSYTMPLSLVPTGASWLPSSLQIITFIMVKLLSVSTKLAYHHSRRMQMAVVHGKSTQAVHDQQCCCDPVYSHHEYCRM